MSLRVWLPLTKNLRNQGLSNVTVTNNGATYSSTGGKLGGCYTFDGNDYIHISMPSEMTTLKGISVVAWVKSTSSTLALGGISNNVNYTVPMCTLYTSGWQFGNDAQNGYRYVSGGTIANTNTWHHVCCTVSDTTIITYLDGVQVASGAISGVTTFTSANFIEIGCDHPGGDEYLTGSVNDFRIYDHALSPLEVKQISQGLVLHYPLNRNGWGNENLLKYTQINTLNKNLLKTNVFSDWDKLTLTTKENYDCYLYPMSQSSTWFSSGTWYNLKANTVYTYSAYIYFTQNVNFNFSSLGHFQVYNSASTASDKAHEDIVSARIYEPSIIQANKWTKIRITFTTNDLANSGFRIYPRYNVSTNVGDLYIRNFKLEEGSTATPWCPNSTDELAITMGLNDNIQYDTSGYGNNGTKVGTFSYDSDTPKYQVSTTFDGTNYISTATPEADILTLSCWVKTSKNKSTSQIIVADSTSQLCISFYSGTIITFYASSGYSTGSKCTLGSAYKENDWNHLVVVKTGTGTRKVYCNGVEQTATSNDYWSSSSTGFTVARRETSTPHAFYGELCDVRAYATALSADDVKSLYNNSAYIDNQGNIYGAVYEEV